MLVEELKTTTALVKDILKNDYKARESDNYLYVKVVSRVNPQALSRPFDDVMYSLKSLGLPSFETVRRARAKIQAAHPELKGSERVQEFRKENEEVFREYAKR